MATANRALADADAKLPTERRFVSQRVRSWRAFRRNRPALVGAVLIVFLVLVAIFAPQFAPYDPLTQSTINRLQSPSADHLLGTDTYGRDLLSRILYGTRVALRVGVLSVAFGAVIGTTLGVTAAFFGGLVNLVIMRVVDVMLSFPDLITGLLVMAVLGAGENKLIIAIGLTVAPRFARIAYGPVLSLKETEFVDAARTIGLTTPRILSRHILPNIAGEIVVMASLWIASAIRLEASLSFIGLGVPPPTPTWGQMIRDGTVYLADHPWLSLAPGLALLITVFAFNLVGDGFRDVLDPRGQ